MENYISTEDKTSDNCLSMVVTKDCILCSNRYKCTIYEKFIKNEYTIVSNI